MNEMSILMIEQIGIDWIEDDYIKNVIQDK